MFKLILFLNSIHLEMKLNASKNSIQFDVQYIEI